ncbi:putative signal transducing protein [Vibrio astriarenae]
MKIYFAKHPPEAHIVAQMLQQSGIECEVRGESLFSLQGELPFNEETFPHVWLIDIAKYAHAQELVEEYLRQRNEVKDWQCLECNEENEGQFGACWQCGATAPH